MTRSTLSHSSPIASYKFLISAILSHSGSPERYQDWEWIEPMKQDLGLTSDLEQTLIQVQRYEEICLECGTPTGWGLSLDIWPKCHRDSRANKWFLLNRYVIDTYQNFESRRLLCQLIYQARA